MYPFKNGAGAGACTSHSAHAVARRERFVREMQRSEPPCYCAQPQHGPCQSAVQVAGACTAKNMARQRPPAGARSTWATRTLMGAA